MSESIEQKAQESFRTQFGRQKAVKVLSVPGRVNLIGEHIDYHDLPVLPIAIQRRISVAFSTRDDGRILAWAPIGHTEIALEPPRSAPSGGWPSYLEAAVEAIRARWAIRRGIDAAIASNLPAAAGLSSSTALLTAFALALLEANGVEPSLDELMEILPEGEQFVGTRGGGMDHAAVLGSPEGGALLIHFAPFHLEAVPIPHNWRFLVAHSLTTAEKSGALRAEYNRRRTAGSQALAKLGLGSFRKIVPELGAEKLTEIATAHPGLSEEERRCFLHVVGEAERVTRAVAAMRANDMHGFGQILKASHESLRDLLQVSCSALDELVDCARQAGAAGARLTGAGFGGCAIALCDEASAEQVRTELIRTFYERRSGFDPELHLFFAEPSAGALAAQTTAR